MDGLNFSGLKIMGGDDTPLGNHMIHSTKNGSANEFDNSSALYACPSSVVMNVPHFN